MTRALTSFHYGGHATFPVRFGWLSKGLDRLLSPGGFAANIETADDLGLGSKMVESLGFWMGATGLYQTLADGEKGAPRKASELAEMIAVHDPYLELPATWWFLHLVLSRQAGTVWSWFFDDFAERLFDRQGCVDAFLRHAREHAARAPSEQAAQKDVACLLSAYAARPGVDVVDPNDVGACPFRDLGLIVRHEAVGRFERVRAPEGLPIEVFLASVSLLSEETGRQALSLRELASLRHGPGRLLCCGLDAIEALVARAGKDRIARGVRIETLAGERHLQVRARSVADWMADMYVRVGSGSI